MTGGATNGWAAEEMGQTDLGDKRLNDRLVSLCDRFSESPESPISQACKGWAETKAAYRFFQNQDVEAADIIATHRKKTAERAKPYKTILAIQDTSYFIYSSHTQTKGLGAMSLKKGKHVEKIFSHGLVMHACLAVTTDGVPLGLLDQNIFVRKLRSAERRRFADVTPMEEKESYHWLEALKNTDAILGDTQVVTVCDREADMYGLFELGDRLKSPVLVRANVDRAINRKSRYAEKDVVRLWSFMRDRPAAGTQTIEIPKRKATPHAKARNARTAILTIKFGSFVFNPPRNNIQYRHAQPPNLAMCAVYAYEVNPPENEEAVEWMLLTNLPITNFQEACEKVHWYCLRWRIEMYFKVLKSGFKVEDCRLATTDRLMRYLAVMSVVAWRLFMITLIARTEPNTPCTEFLSDPEWKILFRTVNKGKSLPEKVPAIGEVIIWIARLGGFLARKSDGMPGTLTLWRGWKRVTDLTEGWNLATHP
jgi:Transposase DNA-binding/Transposase Tn5 dimerisation domain